jgi:glycosyltransferase involved in cell wall biosynthesis
MRILFLSEAISPHIARWQQEFEKLGWDAAVASCDYDTGFSGHKLTAGSGSGPFRYLFLVDQVRELVNKFSPHLVNAHFLPTYGLAAAAAKVHPLIVTLWGSDILVSGDKGMFRRWRTRFVLKRADLVVADAKCLLEAARRIQPFERSLVTSFGVKRSWYDGGRERTLKDVEQVTIISTRRLEPQYDVETLIRAAKILAVASVPFRLKIVGSGTCERRLRELATELELNDFVEFAGHLSSDRLYAAYHSADIYVSSSPTDSTSVSLLEAMSQKLYPVVTDIAGNREWLEDERHFFKAGDAVDLAEKIKGGLTREARGKAYADYGQNLQQRGIREDQMKAAHLTFLKLIDEYERD